MFYSNGNCYVLESNFEFSKEELLKLRSEIIERCSEIIHHDYEGSIGPNSRDNLRIRNYICFSISKNHSKSEGKVCRYVYEEYRFPYLISLIDRILKRDYSAIDEIICINKDREIIPFEERISRASLELDNIPNLNIKEKREKLDELENYLVQLEYNRKQVPVILYYEKVLNLLGIKLLGIKDETVEFDVPKLVINTY